MKKNFICILLYMVACSLFTTEAYAAFSQTQAPCAPVLGGTVPQASRYCLTLENNSSGDAIGRSFSFNAPSAGKASVTFNGSMSCSTFINSGFVVADIATQIVTSPLTAANIAGPSGLRHGTVLLPSPAGNTHSFNLASNRVINYTGPGPKTVHFKLSTLRLDPGVTCFVYNETFSVTFTP
jgi:hypothetical protein